MIRRSTWIMLLIFVAVLAGALVWSRQTQATESAETTPAPETLWSFDEAQIQGLRIEDLKRGTAVEVHRDPTAGWRLTQPDEEPADAGRVEQAVTWLRSPDVSRVLKGEQDLGPFGLADPSTRVTLIMQDGTTRSFDVGSPTGIAGKTYIRVAGGDEIQVISGYSLEDVTGLLDDPPVIPPTSTPEAPTETVPAGPGTPTP
jgi:hypothetical protein